MAGRPRKPFHMGNCQEHKNFLFIFEASGLFCFCWNFMFFFHLFIPACSVFATISQKQIYGITIWTMILVSLKKVVKEILHYFRSLCVIKRRNAPQNLLFKFQWKTHIYKKSHSAFIREMRCKYLNVWSMSVLYHSLACKEASQKKVHYSNLS